MLHYFSSCINNGKEVAAMQLSAHTSETPREGLDREILLLGGVVVVGTVMAILDATIVNVAIPTLGREFHASIAGIQWVMTAYLLAFASVIPVTGWASGRFGAKRVWVTALVTFMAGSALAGLAPTLEALIAFRVLQGLGGGLLMPVGQTILAQAAGPQRMGRVMSVVGVPMLLGPIFGPVIGGAILDQVSWRWIFFVNLPVGLLAVILALRLLPDTAPRPGERLDVGGLLLLSPSIALVVYGMSQAGTSGHLTSGKAVAGIGGGAVLGALFARHAWNRGSRAIIDVSLLGRRGFAAAAATNLLVGIALFGALILLPLYFQVVRDESPLRTGLLMMPQGLGAALAMPVAGWLSDKVGARLVIPTGVVIALAGTGAYAQVGADTTYLLLAAALFVIGLGLGATIVPSMAVAYQSVPREATAHATSTINVVQRLAGSIGTALLAIVLQRRIDAGLPGVHGGLGGLATLPEAARADAAPALAGAFADTFWVALVLVAAAILPALVLPGRATAVAETAESME
jgi:EmrB/QacA subfamily drug resistance transporter